MDDVRALSCRFWVGQVEAYLDGRMRGRARTLFEHHASWCRWCGDYLRGLRLASRAAARLHDEALPKALEESFVQLYKGWRR